MDTVKAVIEKGTQLFAETGQQNELSEIARAIAESLKEFPKTGDKAQEKPESADSEESSKNTEKAQEKPKSADSEIEAREQHIASAPSNTEDPFVKWSSQLRQLELLGFDKLETYVEFLEQEHGDLERVVNRIVRRDM